MYPKSLKMNVLLTSNPQAMMSLQFSLARRCDSLISKPLQHQATDCMKQALQDRRASFAVAQCCTRRAWQRKAMHDNARTHLARHTLSLLGRSKHLLCPQSVPKSSTSPGLSSQAHIRCMHIFVITVQAGAAPACGTVSESASASKA